MKPCLLVTPGLTPYLKALQWQERLASARRANRNTDTLLLLEHPPVLTIGRQGGWENLRVPEDDLQRRGISIVTVNRGGNVTFHGPGQLVGYPILNLKDHRQDIHWYIYNLEEVLIRSVAECGVAAERRSGLTGVWCGDKKLASIGVAVRGWVTTHGFAINIANDLSYFNLIHPCGLKTTTMTSLSRLIHQPVSVAKVAEKVKKHFAATFQLTLQEVDVMELLPAQENNGNNKCPVKGSDPCQSTLNCTPRWKGTAPSVTEPD